MKKATTMNYVLASEVSVMSKRDDQIRRIRKIIDKDGLAAGMEALADMVTEPDPAWLQAIFFLRPYPEEMPHLHEMWEVVTSLKDFHSTNTSQNLSKPFPSSS